ncbi:DUF3975 family protein [Bacillus pacificus]
MWKEKGKQLLAWIRLVSSFYYRFSE